MSDVKPSSDSTLSDIGNSPVVPAEPSAVTTDNAADSAKKTANTAERAADTKPEAATTVEAAANSETTEAKSEADTNCQDLFARARKIIPGGVNSPVRAFGSVGGTPLFIKSAQGARILDSTGRTYVDLVGSWGPALLGHAQPEVVAAVQEAAARGLSFGAPTENEIILAELIAARVPAVEKIRLVSTGTEATMTAIRLARAATERSLIVKFAGCYHGHSDGLLVAAGSGIATQGLPGSAGVTEAVAKQTIVLAYNDVEALEKCFAEQGKEIAAVITEAAPANMGVVPPQNNFNQAIRRVTAEHGALMILDEVLTGFRVGPSGWWGVETGVQAKPDADGTMRASLPAEEDQTDAFYLPDLFTFGKVVGGGMPLAALGGRSEVMDLLAPLGDVYQAGTLSGNPLATAAGITTLRLADEAVYQRIDVVSNLLQKSLNLALHDAVVPFCLNNAGTLFSIFFGEGPAKDGVSNYVQAQAQNSQRFTAFFQAMLQQGVYLPPSGFEAWFISAAHDDIALAQILAALPAATKAATLRK